MGTGRAGDAMPAFDTLLAPAVEQQHPQLWLRAAVSAAIPVLGFRGRQAFDELLSRCETRAVELDDDYRQAVSRWLLGMSVVHRPGAAAAGARARPAVRRRLGRRSGWPSMPPSTNPRAHARRCSRPMLSRRSYHSRYIPDYARAAHGMQELVFGDLAAVIAAGYELVDSATRPMQEHGYRLLLIGGLLSRDEAAVAAAMEAARRAVARQVPGADQLVDGLGPLPRPPPRRAGGAPSTAAVAGRSMVGSTRRRRSRAT